MKPQDIFNKRPQALGNVEALMGFKECNYSPIIEHYFMRELSPDMILHDIDEARRENDRLCTEAPSLKGILWKIGQSGQGDYWILRSNGKIAWYDHDHGEFDESLLVDLEIDFDGFIELAGVINKYELLLDADENYFDIESHKENYTTELNSISRGLFTLYPYGYF